MKTLHIGNEEHSVELQKINKLVSRSKKIVTLTGAGISCNAGIPDFRSSEGLYNMVKKQHPDSVVKGKDLFDISLFRDEKTLSVFCTFMESLYSHTIQARPTPTHGFIKSLNEKKKLIRCYTQNIDGLERHLSLNTGVQGEWKSLDVVQLHGDLNKLGCTNCFKQFDWTEEFRESYRLGETPDCPDCVENFFNRMSSGKRMSSSTVGFLKPNIVLYGENHPHAENIARGLNQDLNKNPQILLIFGTSLKVDGVKRLVRDLAKKIHQRPDGLVIFVNKNPVGSSAWDKVIDYHIETDCDAWCEYLQTQIPDLFKTTMMTPPTTPSKKRVIASPLSGQKQVQKPEFTIYEDLTPEYSPSKKSPRKNTMTDRTMAEITNICMTPKQQKRPAQEEISPDFTPLKAMRLSPSLERVRDEPKPVALRRSKRRCVSPSPI